MEHLVTARLTLVPFSLDLLRAARYDPVLVGQRLGLHVPPDWPGPDMAAALPAFIHRLELDPAQEVWGIRLVALTAERTLIGFAGPNNGPPDPTGNVEIGYDILPFYQCRGYATEAAAAVVEWLFARPEVTCVIADCDSQNSASCRVLEHLDFRQRAPSEGRLNWALPRHERPTAAGLV